MSKTTQLRPLSEQETAELLGDPKFNTLRPSRCLNCGNASDFDRRLFWVGGLRKAEQDSEDTHNALAYHMRQRHGIDSIFFKSHRRKFYIDSAICKRCRSTLVEYDIELSDDLLAQVAKRLGKSVEEVREGINAMERQMAKGDKPGS